MLQERIINVIHKIQFHEVEKDLKEWAMGGAFDALKGVLTVNRYQYPDLDEQKIINQIEDIKRDVWLHMNYEMSALEKVKRSEEHTSELQSLMRISYAVFCLKKQIQTKMKTNRQQYAY